MTHGSTHHMRRIMTLLCEAESITLYHGSDDPITKFDMAHASEGALFFTASPRIARTYGASVVAVQVSPKKVAHTTPQAWAEGDDATDPDRLRADGYDLLVIKGGPDAPRGFRTDIYVVLDTSIIVTKSINEATSKLASLFRKSAWQAFMDNLAENESELEDYVNDYEDETGHSVNIPRARIRERGGELHDPAFLSWCQAQISERADGLAAEFQRSIRGGMIRGWRAIHAPPNWQPSGPNPGIHWGRSPADAVAHFGREEPGDVTHIIEADIPLSSIDWYFTVKANLSEEFGDENEIRIFEPAPVKIIRVKRNGA